MPPPEADEVAAGAAFEQGNALLGERRYADAALCFERAAALRPGFVEAYNNLGFVLQATNRGEESLA